MGRRHKIDIMAEILRLSKVGSKKTRLVYLANINFNMLRKYLSLLESKGFIYKSEDIFYTSRDGFAFLKQYEELMMAWNLLDDEVKEPVNGLSSGVIMTKRRISDSDI